MNDCESCMLYYMDPDDGPVCIGNFKEFQDREFYISQLWTSRYNYLNPEIDARARTLPSDEDRSNNMKEAYLKFPCKYHTMFNEFVAWKQ